MIIPAVFRLTRLLPLFAFLFCHALAGQASPEPSPATPPEVVIQKQVRRVIVDVVVTDSSGKLVGGLNSEDFSINEDGKPQQILSFDMHSSDGPAEFVPPRVPHLPPNTFINVPPAPERGPLNAVFLDLLDTSLEDQPFARKQLSDFISDKPDGTRFAIFVLSDSLYLVQGFTQNRKQLLDVLDSRNARHIPRMFLDADNYRPYLSPLGALIDIARFLEGLPGHKNVIWLAGSFPYFLPAALASPDSDSTSVLFPDSNFQDEVKAAADALARAQAAVYPVDARGVTGAWKPGLHDALNASYLIEDSIAEATGGHAFYSNNDLKSAMVEAIETGSNYYTLSYSPTNQDYNGKLRHIHVEVSKHGYRLQYRRAYFGEDPERPPRYMSREEKELLSQPGVIQQSDSLYINMQHGAPIAHRLIFGAHVRAIGSPAMATPEQMANLAQQPAYFKVRKKNGAAKPLAPVPLQTYAITYRVLARQLAQGLGFNGQFPTIELAAAAFDDEGKMLNGIVQKADVVQKTEVNPASQQDKRKPQDFYVVEERLDVPAKAAWLRFAVRDTATDRIGAMEIALPLAPERAN